MKKKILVVFTGPMELGGIERSLLGLLDAIDYQKYDVDLFLYGHHGPLFSLVNKNVNLLPEKKELAYLRDSFKSKIVHGALWSAYFRVLEQFRKEGNDRSWARVLKKVSPTFPKEYDIALGFFLPFDIIKDYVNAKTKIGWVHTDYSVERVSEAYLSESYDGLDYVVNVSDSCKESFDQIIPKLSNKSIVIENILSKEFILDQSHEMVEEDYSRKDTVTLLSIGRFCYQKNFDNVPEICSYILQNGINVKWYLMGYGVDEEKIREKIHEWNVENHVIILGKKSNPYPYIKQCDFYVQPSRYEGKSVSVREAQILGKVVVITDYPTAGSQISNGVDGVIVPLDNKQCAEGICKIIRDKHLCKKIADNIQNMDFTNSEEVNKIYQLMENGRMS